MKLFEKLTQGDIARKIAQIKRASCDRPDICTEVYNSVNEFIFEHDLDGVFMGICPRFVGFLGYRREEMIGQNVKDLL